ncbi:DUF4249 domain-containing protein [Microscilla marina]|uniref:Uncharacterized protein n=1 Tax=Microscilla marina ATCC 23134 TaxID=313606 RepID=A1ZRS4_MICM2|nr:DUF4249 domain-containing protein [Microscilla marina]EAY26979.1 hypothetical protein M23134_03631 [Microscilla marina ATCC 23134]
MLNIQDNCRFSAFLWVLMLTLMGLSACDSLQKDITIDLPPYAPEIVVECYLEHGKPYRLLLTESTNYFGAVELPPLPQAKVSIVHNGVEEVLKFESGFDANSRKFYNYVGSTIVDSTAGGDYALKVEDVLKGRLVTGVTSFLPAPQLDTIEARFRDKDTTAFLLTKFQDNDSDKPNYYRIIINKDSLGGELTTEFSFEGRFKTGNQITIGTGYDFRSEDTVFVAIYHIKRDYYDFLETIEDARQANGNPFAQPAVVKSTITGGVGVFTALAYARQRIILKKE